MRASDDNRWQVFQFALGSTPGAARLNVSGHSTLNSLRKPDFEATDFAARKREVVCEVDVAIDTLDRQLPKLLQSLGVRRPYLKLDTQGFDLEVLYGARERLCDIVALQFEGSVVPLYQGAPSYAELLAHLTTCGYSLSAMFPVAHDVALRLLEFDCVMVHTDLANKVHTDAPEPSPSAD